MQTQTAAWPNGLTSANVPPRRDDVDELNHHFPRTSLPPQANADLT